jgi:hypothetical protein
VKLTGTTALTVREGLLVPLRPKGWEQEAESRYAGEIVGREARVGDAPGISTDRSWVA